MHSDRSRLDTWRLRLKVNEETKADQRHAADRILKCNNPRSQRARPLTSARRIAPAADKSPHPTLEIVELLRACSRPIDVTSSVLSDFAAPGSFGGTDAGNQA